MLEKDGHALYDDLLSSSSSDGEALSMNGEDEDDNALMGEDFSNDEDED